MSPHLIQPLPQMPKEKGQRSARRCVDGCGSTNPKTISSHKRQWQSSVNVKPTKFVASMSRLSSRTHSPPSAVGGPSHQKGPSTAARNPRLTGWCLFSRMSQVLTHNIQNHIHSTMSQIKWILIPPLSRRTSQPPLSPHTIVTPRVEVLETMQTARTVISREEGPAIRGQ